MSEVVTGRIPWGAASSGGGNRGDRIDYKSDYFRPNDDGDYLFALLETAPQPFLEHWTVDSTGKRRSVRCALRGCTVCKEAKEKMNSPSESVRDVGKQMAAKTKYAIEVYVLGDRGQKLGTEVGRPAIFEMTKQVYDGISAIKNTLDQAGGSLSETIIHLNRNKNRKPNVYVLQPVPRALQFTDKQKELIQTFRDRKLDLGKLYTPPSDEDNMRRLGRTGDQTQVQTTGTESSVGGTEFDEDSW